MKKFMQVVKSNAIVQAVLLILFGLFLAISPTASTITLVYILAACIGVSGIASIISHSRQQKEGAGGRGSLILGILMVILAIVIFIFPQAVAGLFSLVFGILLLLVGLINVFQSIGMKDFGGSAWIIMLVASLLITAGGVVIVVNPFEATVTAVLVLGILLIATGIVDLVIYYFVSKNLKTV